LSAIDALLENNRRFAQGFDRGHLPRAPAKRIAIVACMDARLDLGSMLGLDPGDAHVIRNAGGAITNEEIRSLAVSQRLLGTEEVMVIHHTDCGMYGLDGDAFAAQLEAETGSRPRWETLSPSDLEQEVRSSIERIRRSPFLPRNERVRGFVYQVETGRLREVP
jgi:carbonic anhydrase